VVLLGDAAHSMVNHMVQSASTAIEGGAFLGRVLREVVSGRPVLNGYIWHLPEGQAARNRDKAMEVELSGKQPMRSPNLYADPATVLEVYGYDAEAHAGEAVKFSLEQRVLVDDSTDVTRKEADKIVNWFLPDGGEIAEKSVHQLRIWCRRKRVKMLTFSA